MNIYQRYSFTLEQLAAIPDFAVLGPLFKSSSTPLQLTESETEYVVNCIKHTFKDHIVFQVLLVCKAIRIDVGHYNVWFYWPNQAGVFFILSYAVSLIYRTEARPEFDF